jgi:GNAT superfamily N-acetyltransferase
LNIRLMTAADLPAAMLLKQAAAWNQTADDWRAVLELSPDACWVAEIDGQVAGSTTLLCYGAELAWVGMVLTALEFRRRGVARRLVSHALADCSRRGIACSKLDATDMGRPLYLELGYIDEQPIERWRREAPLGSQQFPLTAPFDLEACAPLDRLAFGLDRKTMLERLAAVPHAVALTTPDGFILGRPGVNAYFLGPCAALSRSEARRLILAALHAVRAHSFFWDLLPGNRQAAELAAELGFKPIRRLMRMVRPGLKPFGALDRTWATAGFEYG